MTLDHLGIAVDSPAAQQLFAGLLGAAPYKSETVAREGVRTVFFGDGGAPRAAPKLELLEALGPDSPVAAFLGKRGPGLHHIAFRVDRLEREMARVRALGIRTLADAPRPGADQTEIVFLHPKDTGGVLVELVAFRRAPRETVTVPWRDGVAAHVSGPEAAPTLVALHGALGSTELETDRLIRFWERRFRVVGLDLPGHGASAAVAGVPTWTDYADAVRAAFDHLALRDVRLFGFSLGAGVALAVAAAEPARVARLAVHAQNVRWRPDEVARMIDPMEPQRLAAEHPFWAQRLAETHGDDAGGAPRWPALAEQVRAFTRALPEQHLSDAALAAVRQPTLVSAGAADRFFDVQHAVDVWRALPDADLWVLPGVDHPIQTVDARAFAARVADHLDGAVADGAARPHSPAEAMRREV